MTFKALRRPSRLGRPATQLTDARRTRRQPPDVGVVAAGRVTSRWAHGSDGRLVLEWTLEQPKPHLTNRKRGSDA